VLVTVVGWLALLSGLARMLFPTQVAVIAARVGQTTGLISDHDKRALGFPTTHHA
jgi:hypothetical protein